MVIWHRFSLCKSHAKRLHDLTIRLWHCKFTFAIYRQIKTNCLSQSSSAPMKLMLFSSFRHFFNVIILKGQAIVIIFNKSFSFCFTLGYAFDGFRNVRFGRSLSFESRNMNAVGRKFRLIGCIQWNYFKYYCMELIKWARSSETNWPPEYWI